MFPSSTSSSPQSSMAFGGGGGGGGGLMRYTSAPSSVISSAVDSVVGNRHHHFLFPSSEAESAALVTPNLNRDLFSNSTHNNVENHNKVAINKISNANARYSGSGLSIGGSASSSSLARHMSSPARFLNQLPASVSASGDGRDRGFLNTNGAGNYNEKGQSDNGHGMARLNSQLSLTHKEFLSQISEKSTKGVGDHDTAPISSNHTNKKNDNSQIKTPPRSLGIESWYDNNRITFSVASNKRAKTMGLEAMDPDQFQFSMSQSIERMPTMEKLLLHVPEDSVPCKTRAKRGFAIHPRSIAERERRTRISGKLKKLQDLVPNMDKQTSYADMLDLAVQHIKSLKNQVEKLHKDLDSCSCGCKMMMKDS